jgi:hypothetical protein
MGTQRGRLDRSSQELLRDAENEHVAPLGFEKQNSLVARVQLRRFAAHTLTESDSSRTTSPSA